MRITHPLSIQEKPEAVSRKSHNIKKTEPEKKQLQMWKLRSRRQKRKKKKEKKTNYHSFGRKMQAQTYQPSPIIYQKCPSSILSRPPPGKIRFSRRKRTKKIRDTKDPDNFNHHAKMVGSWKETGKAVGGDTLLLYLTRNTHISSILTSRSPLLYTHHPGRSKENSSLTRVHCR